MAVLSTKSKKKFPTAEWITIILIVAITYIVFSPSLKCGFTNWDDNKFVQTNPLVIHPSIQVAKIFSSVVMENDYYPLTTLSLALNYQIGGLNPEGYHAWNLWLHLFNTVLVFVFILRITQQNLLMAAIVAFFFGTHPMHVESVTWITERKDVLFLCFFLLGLLCYLQYRYKRKVIWYAAAMVLFVCSCLSKGTAITFPIIVLLLDYLLESRIKIKDVTEKIPLFLISAGFGVATVLLHHTAIENTVPVALGHRFIFASYGAIMYIIKLFCPYQLSAFYPYPDVTALPSIFYISPVILLLLIAATCYLFIKQQRSLVFGIAFYFVSIILMLQFLPTGSGEFLMADRYSYLAHIGILFFVAHLTYRAWDQKTNNLTALKYPLTLLLAVGAIWFPIQTYARTQVWMNSETLWTNVLSSYPQSATAFYNRGVAYYDEQKDSLAMLDFNSSILCNPRYANAYNNRGALYARYLQDSLALNDYTIALKLDSNNVQVYNNLGKFYSANTATYHLSLNYCNKALQLDSTYYPAYYNRAQLYSKTNNNDLALNDYNKVIALNPNYHFAYNDRGSLFYKEGKIEPALKDYNTALVIDSTFAPGYSNRAIVFFNSGLYNEAERDFRKAIELDGTFAEPNFNLGFLLDKTGAFTEAIKSFSNYLQLRPADPQGYNARGQSYFNAGNYSAALVDFSRAAALNPNIPDYQANLSKARQAINQHK